MLACEHARSVRQLPEPRQGVEVGNAHWLGLLAGDFATLHAPPSLQPPGMLAYCSISILLFTYALLL